jgi:GMP synthase-like glutamine amidotransferase
MGWEENFSKINSRPRYKLVRMHKNIPFSVNSVPKIKGSVDNRITSFVIFVSSTSCKFVIYSALQNIVAMQYHLKCITHKSYNVEQFLLNS